MTNLPYNQEFDDVQPDLVVNPNDPTLDQRFPELFVSKSPCHSIHLFLNSGVRVVGNVAQQHFDQKYWIIDHRSFSFSGKTGCSPPPLLKYIHEESRGSGQ
jgi:hypothetical protein